MTAIAPTAAPAAAEARGDDAALPASVLTVLVDNRARFLAFLEKRVGGRDVAEEILQQAYVRGMDRGNGLRAGESAVAWFYRLLRNVLIDHWRRGDAERRALATYAGEAELTAADDGALLEAVCGCVTGLVGTLKPELANIIRSVDLDGVPLRDYAARAGISANNAAVRLHRARQALGRQIRRTCAAGSIAALRDCECDCAVDAPTG
ncbi:MAG TPA: sigma factor [Polyangia bacterium]|jgi:RNA polymerase sigma factor (sigma-70 family)|nr:sigma factor [Polyangia bacterium]